MHQSKQQYSRLGRPLGPVMLAAAVWITSVGIPATARPEVADLAPLDWASLMEAADRAQAEGNHAEAARLYDQAYRARPKPLRSDEMGEVIIRAALRNYQDMLEEIADDVELQRAQLALFEDFLCARAPESRPRSIADSLVEVSNCEETQADALDESTPVLLPLPIPEPIVDRPLDSLARRKLDAVLVGLGATSFVGGMAMLAGGSWVFAETTKRSNAYSAKVDLAIMEAKANDRTEQQIQSDNALVAQAVEDLEAYRKQSRSRAAGLVVSGAILAGVGIGATAWGAVLMRRHVRPEQSTRLAPALTRDYAGLLVAVEF